MYLGSCRAHESLAACDAGSDEQTSVRTKAQQRRRPGMTSVRRFPAATGGSYSDGVAVTGPGTWIHVSGQVGFGADQRVAGSMYEQANKCFDHIEHILQEFGSSLSDIVRITSFLVSLDDYSGFALARAERFGDSLPASAAVQVTGLLAGALVEVEAVAFRPAD
jgi:2-iminobutanoate/2-iminopropanoate deaminase